jgi:hypothetical protein
MTVPITSAYQTDPWEPTVYLNASDAAEEQAAAAQYTQYYGGTPITTDQNPPAAGSPGPSAPVPTLMLAYTRAPDLVLPSTPATGGTPGTFSPVSPFFIDLGVARENEQTCLTATATVVDAYDTLKATVMDAISSKTIFGQAVTSPDFTGTPDAVAQAMGQPVGWDQLNSTGQALADAVKPQMEELLYTIGALTEGIGQFNAMLHDTFQTYTNCDSESAFANPVVSPEKSG